MKSKYKPSVGDVTLIKDDLPRGTWRMGRIKELVNSRDGEVRSAEIVLPNNKVIGRPLNLLFPIECPTTKAKESLQSYDDVNDRKQGDDQQANNKGADQTDLSLCCLQTHDDLFSCVEAHI